MNDSSDTTFREASQPEHEPDAHVYLTDFGRAQSLHLLGQERPVYGDYLGHVNHRPSGKARVLPGERDVAGSFGQSKIGTDDQGDGGLNTTTVEIVGLQYQ